MAVSVGGGGIKWGYAELREASAATTELSQARAIFQFEKDIENVLSQLNATTVRDFTDQQLWDAKTANQSIRDQRKLPIQILDQLRNTLWMIDAEIERRRREAIKHWEERQKAKQ